MKPWETFLEKYRAFGQKPTRQSHARLFAPDATIFHPGMTEPMPASQYVDFLAQGLKRLPEFHLIGRLVIRAGSNRYIAPIVAAEALESPERQTNGGNLVSSEIASRTLNRSTSLPRPMRSGTVQCRNRRKLTAIRRDSTSRRIAKPCANNVDENPSRRRG
jgi:hypothetical protein